jgi:hypothetical protein
VRIPALLLLIASCTEEEKVIPIPPECNGAVELCERRFDEVAYATTHNAMSNAQDDWESPNQNFNIGRQLGDGVRGFMLDAYEWGEDVLLCHGFCPLGSLPLSEGLTIMRRFLHDHRGEVVTIIFESYVTPEEMDAAFASSGLDKYVHAQVAGTPWPTLREMIDADERVVVFTNRDGGTRPWYMNVWAHAFDNPFAAETIDDFSCGPDRGNPANPLFIFNHFLSAPIAVPDQASTVNANPLLIDRARECMQVTGSLPNFVTVDFYDEGDVLAAVRSLNGL